jgi:hypothetical protein
MKILINFLWNEKMGSRGKACNSRRIEGVNSDKEEVALMNSPHSSIVEIGLPC